MKSRIEQLGIGSGGEGPRDCRRFKTVEQCRAQSECRWVRGSGSREGMCVTRSGPSLENDSLAGLALLYLSREVTRLGELIDQAIFAYPSPQYLSYIAESCNLAREIRNRAQAAKLSATLPPVELIGPAEFDPVINEMNAVRSDLQCF